MNRTQKIFGIGLPKTGTTSLHHAAKILGLRSVHWPRDPQTVAELREGNYQLSVMQTCDIVSDVPIPAIYPQLDRAFPGSKFILTTRDRGAWLESQARAGFNQHPPKPGSDREFFRVMLYGVNAFNAERFAWIHDSHHQLVERYFAGDRANDLLTLDIGKGGAAWEPLCAFLGYSVPHVPFPHSNRAREISARERHPVGLIGQTKQRLRGLMMRGPD